MLRTLGEAVGIPSRLAANVIREQTAAAGIWIEELDQLPFDANSIRKLRRLVRARVGHIQPDRQQRG
jgi:serine/threonine-protein kinase HipA